MQRPRPKMLQPARRTVHEAAAHPRATPAARYAAVRAATLKLVEPLSAEDCAPQSMSDASPAKWHLAHTSWFFETFILERFVPNYRPFHPAFRVLFNSYYNAVGDKHPRAERGLVSRPGLDDVLAYRRHVDTRMEALLEKPPAEREAFAALVDLGVNHEEQHQELILTDIKHLLSKNPLRPAYRGAGAEECAIASAVRQPAFPGGLVQIGHAGDGFAFDNEGPRHVVFVHPFRLASRPVTNGDYLAFMDDDGYRRPELWLSLGWDAVQRERWTAPLYWERDGADWQQFTLHGMRRLDRNAPVCHVSCFESDAYARWAQARLPTEAEWEVAAADAPVGGNLVESGVLHPRAAGGDHSSQGLVQLFGDVWEWTQSAYSPYPGYRTAPGAVGEYNGKFMCNQYVLRGGSCATPVAHIRATYRNFFPPEARWQFSGLRLAWDVA